MAVRVQEKPGVWTEGMSAALLEQLLQRGSFAMEDFVASMLHSNKLEFESDDTFVQTVEAAPPL